MTQALAFKIRRFKEIDSTNSAAFRFAQKGARAGSVFLADYQTKGRGKWGREWVSPRGKDLLFSILLYPTVKVSQAAGITQIACRSVAKVLEEKYGLAPTFKRPNDVLIQGRKISGVLIESKGRSNGQLESLVVGIGLNVNSSVKDLFPGATSVLEETGKRQARGQLLEALLAQLEKDLTCYF